MRKRLLFILFIFAVLIRLHADPYADRVVEFIPGTLFNSDFQNPDSVLGPPRATDPSGYNASLDVLNLGTGGSIILAFDDVAIYNGDGVDFAVFENPFYINGNPSRTFLEPGFVFVSDGGTNWVQFKAKYIAQTPALQYDDNPSHYQNFAGIKPVFANPSEGISAVNPAVSGGDWFDLEDIKQDAAAANVDIDKIKFIKIVDARPHIDNDSFGNMIPGAYMAGGLNGFDLDAVAARYTHALSSVSSKWTLYE